MVSPGIKVPINLPLKGIIRLETPHRKSLCQYSFNTCVTETLLKTMLDGIIFLLFVPVCLAEPAKI